MIYLPPIARNPAKLEGVIVNQIFCLVGESIALCDLLKCCGVAPTGGAAKRLVAEAAVHVDGQLELRKTRKIYAGQRVWASGTTIDVIAAYD